MIDFVLDKEFRSVLPPQAKEEHDALEAEILDGLHVDALVLAKIEGEPKLILAGGYNRHDICTKHGIDPPTRTKKFASRQAVIEWIVRDQLGRRNLTDERRAYFIGKQYQATKPPKGGIGENHESVRNTDSENLRSAADVGEEHGIDEQTVRENADYAKALDALLPEEKAAVLAGVSGLSKKKIISGEKPILCAACRRRGRVGQDFLKNCVECKSMRDAAKPKRKKGGTKKKATPKPVDPKLPKDVANALADEWHTDSAATLKAMITKAKSVFSWSYYLSHEIVTHLERAKDCLISAAPKKKCSECGGMKKIEGEKCNNCHGCGYLASHA